MNLFQSPITSVDNIFPYNSVQKWERNKTQKIPTNNTIYKNLICKLYTALYASDINLPKITCLSIIKIEFSIQINRNWCKKKPLSYTRKLKDTEKKNFNKKYICNPNSWHFPCFLD